MKAIIKPNLGLIMRSYVLFFFYVAAQFGNPIIQTEFIKWLVSSILANEYDNPAIATQPYWYGWVLMVVLVLVTLIGKQEETREKKGIK